jgi:hypothetical protein
VLSLSYDENTQDISHFFAKQISLCCGPLGSLDAAATLLMVLVPIFV